MISPEDQIGISDALNRYAFAVDVLGNNPFAGDEGADSALDDATHRLSECLSDDALVYLYFEGPTGPATQAGDGGPEAFARFVRAYFTAYDYVGTHHQVTNVLIDAVDGDDARVLSYINSMHWMSDQRILLAPILYVDQLVRTGSRWKIKRREIQVQRFWVADGYAPTPTDPTLARPVA